MLSKTGVTWITSSATLLHGVNFEVQYASGGEGVVLRSLAATIFPFHWLNPMLTAATGSTVLIRNWPSVLSLPSFRTSSGKVVADPLLVASSSPLSGVVGNALKITFPAGSRNPSNTNGSQGGIGFYVQPDSFAAAKTVVLDYDVFFPAGFNFVQGGKLPGLFGGITTSCSGGNLAADCFSTRYMFRTAGAGEVYAYVHQSIQGRLLCSCMHALQGCITSTLISSSPHPIPRPARCLPAERAAPDDG